MKTQTRISSLKALIFLASATSLLFFLYYVRRGEILLYGDAVAHLNIARRVFDSQTPGLLQLGTVWLPLPHILMIPFVWSDEMWQTGLGGSIPSMVAYVFAVVGIFRITRRLLQSVKTLRSSAALGAWTAAMVFAANPNLLYLQATAMTEALYLAFFIWAVVHFFDWYVGWVGQDDDLVSQHAGTSLWKCSACIAAAELTRYDAWLLAAAAGLAVSFVALKRLPDQALRIAWIKFVLVISVAPLLWLAYNAAIYRDPLEFARGSYSARAIEQRTAAPNTPGHPGSGNLIVSASFFLKASQLNLAMGNWGRVWLLVVLTAIVLARRAGSLVWPLFLLCVPLVFYATSIAYGGVPLFVPTWWPNTWYNIRYGLQLLPLFSIAFGIGIAWFMRTSHRWYSCIGLALAVFAVTCYLLVWRATPLCLTEAWVNSRTKLTLESAVARFVGTLPPNTRYLMYVGDHVGVFQQAGIPLRQVINEGNHRPWMKPSDPDGLWERALAHPHAFVDAVITYQGDAADLLANRDELQLLTEIHTLGQPAARIYRTQSTNQSH